MKPSRWMVALVLSTALPAAVRAQTLEQCLELARRQAPALRAAEANVSRADQAIREARAALSPTLSLDASWIENSESQRSVFPIPGVSPPPVFKLGSATVLDVRTEAQYPLYTGGRNGALVRAAEAARGGQVLGRDQARSDLTLRVSQAFYRAIAAQRLEEAALEALASARDHHRISASRVRAGIAPRLDSLEAQVDVAQRLSAMTRASEAVRIARVELWSAIGAPPDSTEQLVEPGPPPGELPALEPALDQALHRRPELSIIDHALLENSQRLAAARAGSRPQVHLQATAQYLGPNRNEQYWNVNDPGLKTYRLFAGVGLSVPLFDGGLVGARAGQLVADREALAARRYEAELEVRQEVERALSDARVALTLWQSDSSRVAAAHEALRISDAGYKGGTITGTDVRDAETALADARAQAAQSLMDYWTARAALDRAIGAAVNKED